MSRLDDRGQLSSDEYEWRLLDFEDIGKEPKFRTVPGKDLDAMEHKAEKKLEGELPTVKKASQEFKLSLHQARMAAGLKQKDLAVKLKVTAGVVADWESGKAIPSGAQRAMLNKILKVTLPKA